jgi:chaperonin GroES
MWLFNLGKPQHIVRQESAKASGRGRVSPRFGGSFKGKTEEERRIHMNVRPLHDRLIVKRVEEKETIKGGIIIPDSAKEKPQEGEVIAAGNGKKTEDGKIIPLDVKAGDRILFGKYSGTEIKVATTNT